MERRTANRLAALDTAGPLLWLTPNAARSMSEPAAGPEGILYVQTRRYGLWALNPDGTARWERGAVQPRWPWWYGGPALAQDGIIYGAGVDRFWAVGTAGSVLWAHVVDSARTRQPFLGAPAIAPDGTIYTWTSTHMYAFWGSAPPEPDSPWPMWRHDAQRTGWAAYEPRYVNEKRGRGAARQRGSEAEGWRGGEQSPLPVCSFALR